MQVNPADHSGASVGGGMPSAESQLSASPPGAGDNGEKTPPSRFRAALRAVISQDYIGVLVVTILMVLVIGSAHPRFFAPSQLIDILNQAVFVALLAGGMSFLLAMRELDLSVGSTYGLTSMCVALLIHGGMNAWVGAIIGILLGAVLGLVNALLIQLFRLPSIVATLTTLSIYRGLAFALSKGAQVLGPSLQDPFAQFVGGSLWGIPTDVYIMIGVVILLTVVLGHTPFGYRVRAIGSNPDAAVFSGLPVLQVRLIVLMMTGALGGLAGVLSLGYFGAADPNLGTGYELLAIAAAVIGGTSLRGGKATIVGSMLGAILLGVVASGLVYFNVPINWSAFATGAVILLAVILDSLVRRGRANRSSQL
jgi:ribose transport system permease protein